jgi:hypothetical protein
MKPFPARGEKKKHSRPEGKEHHAYAKGDPEKSQNPRAAVIPPSGYDVGGHRDE